MSGRGPELSIAWAADYDVTEVDNIVERNKWRRGAALEILEDIQEHYGWVSPAAIQRVADLTEYSPNYLYGVVTFYDEFRIAPPGTVRVDICNGSACALNREARILHELERLLRIEEVTDASPYELFSQNKFGYVSDDGKVLLRKVDCVGACQLAPLFRVGREGDHHDTRFIGPVSPSEVEPRLRQAFAELGVELPSSGDGT
jgi:NADH-quinone oxidoreductase subunit E